MALAAGASSWEKLAGSARYVQHMACNTADCRRIFQATAHWVLGAKPGNRRHTNSWQMQARDRLKEGLEVLGRSMRAFPPLCPLTSRCVLGYLLVHEESPCALGTQFWT